MDPPSGGLVPFLLWSAVGCYVAWLVFYSWYGGIVEPDAGHLRDAHRRAGAMHRLTHLFTPSMGGSLRNRLKEIYEEKKGAVLKRNPVLDLLVRTRGLIPFGMGTVLLLLYLRLR